MSGAPVSDAPGRPRRARTSGPAPGARLKGIDGLRGLAVVVVVLFHAGVAQFQGGYLGVEAFFVVSGFLITWLLAREATAARPDLLAFWLRRFWRLFPALGALGVVLAMLLAVLRPEELAGLRRDLPAALLGLSNWQLTLERQDYFEAASGSRWLQHAWSLAIEAQFYLVWGVVLVAGVRWFRAALPWLAIGAAVLSAGWLVALAGGGDLSRGYYGTDARLTGLLLGSALGLLVARWPAPRVGPAGRALADGAVLGALLAFGAACIVLTPVHPLSFRGGVTVVAVLIVGAIAGLVWCRPLVSGWLLSLPVMLWLGTRSYSIYLWHWPLLELTRRGIGTVLDGPWLLVLQLVLIAAVSEASYRLVERVFLRGWPASWRTPAGRRMAFPGAAALAGLAVGLLILAPEPTTADALRAELAAQQSVAASIGSRPARAVAPDSSIHNVPTIPGAPAASLPAAVAPAGARSADAPAPAEPVRPGRATTVPPPMPVAPTIAPVQPVSRAVPLAVTAFGDSVMLGAASALAQALPGLVELDARVSRQPRDFLEQFRQLRRVGRVTAGIVLHIGNNGYLAPEMLDEMLGQLDGAERVVVVNLRVPRQWEASNNQAIIDAVGYHPNAVIADWRALALADPSLVTSDGIHMSPAGATAYAALIASALNAP